MPLNKAERQILKIEGKDLELVTNITVSMVGLIVKWSVS